MHHGDGFVKERRVLVLPQGCDIEGFADTNSCASAQAMHCKPVSSLNSNSTYHEVLGVVHVSNLVNGTGGLNNNSSTGPGETFVAMVRFSMHHYNGPPAMDIANASKD